MSMPVILYKYDIFDTHIQLTEYAPTRFFFQHFCLSLWKSLLKKKTTTKTTIISCIRRGTLLKLLSGSSSSEEEHFLLIWSKSDCLQK